MQQDLTDRNDSNKTQERNKAKDPNEPNWYALRVFYNHILRIKEELEQHGHKTYMAVKKVRETVNGRTVERQVQLVPSLLFVRCTQDELLDFKRDHYDELMLYRCADSTDPAPIDEEEMRLFILVTSVTDGQDVALLGPDKHSFDFRPGDRVRVIEGPFKGAEGVIKRIKKDRKLLVAVRGVVTIAVSHIPAAYLEKTNKTNSVI